MNINLYRFEIDSNDEFNLEKLIYIEKITDCSQKTTPLPDIIKSSSGDVLYHKHIEEIELNDKKYISTIISGNYTHNSPEWEYLAEKSIFNKKHLSPFCIIFLYSKDTPKIIWAYCYGAGYRILKKNMSTEDYGQRIALDSIDNERITLMERTNLIGKKYNKTTSKILQGGNSGDHKYDMNSESISSIGGKAKYNKDKIKESFYGSNNFKTNIETTIEKFEDDIKNLIKHCTEYELIYKKEHMHNDLNYFYSTSKEEKEQLNEILTKNMQRSSSSRNLTFDITYPQDLHNLVSDGDLISKAVIKTPCKNTNHKIHELDIQNIEDLSLEFIRKFLNDKRKDRKNNPYTTDNIPKPCLDNGDVNIKEIEIEIHTENEGKKIDSIPLFNWLTGSYNIRKNSRSLKEGMYYLDNGTWKKPSKRYENFVIEHLKKLYNTNYSEHTTLYNILEQTALDSVRSSTDEKYKIDENFFNASLVKNLKNNPNFRSKKISILDIGAIGSASLDIGEKSKMEISDVYINKGTYIYVKNHADVTTISHLINQSYMSAKYMQYSPNYKNILDKLKDVSKKQDSNKITFNSDFAHVKESDLHIKEFILVLIVDKTFSKNDEYSSRKKFPLTLRTQIPLYQHIMDLKNMGIKVSLLAISSCDAIEKYQKRISKNKFKQT